jgi:hemolysin III
MNNEQQIQIYPPLEEKINIFSHATGLLLSIIALAFLVTRASLHGDAWHVASFSIFGASLIVLYTASTVYHSSKAPQTRSRLRIVDHASIYVLIAGTYTPFTLVTLNGTVGWVIFAISWGMALTGIILKLFFTGRYGLLSTAMYIFMGWLIIFAIKPLINNLPVDGIYWLVAGGLAYTLGAILYAIKKIKFNHAIFHVFVLLGSFCHFMAVYFYVLPDH